MSTATETLTVRIEIWHDRIAADIPWQWREDGKKIPGRMPHWDKTTEPARFKCWSYPLSMATCRAFRETFGNSLSIGPELTKWAWDERRAEEAMELLRAGANADLPNVRKNAPKLWTLLQARPFQIAGARAIVDARRFVLGDEPRLGKTYQALAAIEEAQANRVLIAAPRTATRTVWGRKIYELLGERAFIAQGERKTREKVIADFDAYNGPKFLVINLEMLRIVRMYVCPDGTEWKVRPGLKRGCQADHSHRTKEYPEYPELFRQPFDAIFIDESHNVLASSKHVVSGSIPQIRLGAMRLKSTPDGLRVAMSGTPWRSKLDRAWGTLNWIKPQQFSSYWRFAEEQFGTRPGYGMSKIVYDEPRNMKAYQDMLRPYYLARTKAEVAPQLPPIVYAGTPPRGNPAGSNGVYVEMDERQAKAYRQMQANGLARLADGKIMSANGRLAELTRLRQFAGSYGKWSGGNAAQHGEFVPALPSGKLDWVLDFLAERKETSGKVVIATQFTKLANLFAEEIKKAGWEVVMITGESTDRQRDNAQDAFMFGTPRVAIINIFAGGEAIDLSAADEMIFLDEPWMADPIKQAENRIQNLAKRQQLTIYRLRTAGTIEETIAELTTRQRELLMAGRPEAIKELQERLASLPE